MRKETARRRRPLIAALGVTSTSMPRIDVDELQWACEWVSTDVFEKEAFICLETGKIYCLPDEIDDIELFDEPPENLGDAKKYVPVPAKRDLGLGSRLALDFARKELPGQYDSVREIFRRRGAFDRFKRLLDSEGQLEAWYAFSSIAMSEGLLSWCLEHGFEVGDGSK